MLTAAHGGGEKPGGVDELCAIEVYTSEVTPTPTWQIPSIPHVDFPSHVHPRAGGGSRPVGPNNSKSILSP